MYTLNDKIKNLQPYMPAKSGCSVRLDANESFLPAPEDLRELFCAAAREIEYNRYPDPYAGKACRAFAEFYGVDSSCVTAGNGSDELINVILNGFFCKGDSVVITSPDFSMYAFYAHIAEIDTVTVQKDSTLFTDTDAVLRAACSANARGIILSNPCNPTSQMADGGDILELCRQLPDTLIIADEAYMDFAGGDSLLKEAMRQSNLIVLKTCSKFGFAAIRLGFAVCCPALTNGLRAVKSPYNVNTFTDAAGGLLFARKEYLRGVIAKIIKQRDKLAALLVGFSGVKGVKVHGAAANFVLITMPDAARAADNLRNNGISVRLLKDMNALRVTAGSDAEHSVFVEKFEECLRNYE